LTGVGYGLVDSRLDLPIVERVHLHHQCMGTALLDLGCGLLEIGHGSPGDRDAGCRFSGLQRDSLADTRLAPVTTATLSFSTFCLSVLSRSTSES